MPIGSHHRDLSLVVLGLGGIAVGLIPFLWTVRDSSSAVVYNLSPSLAYAVVAWVGWQWVVAPQTDPAILDPRTRTVAAVAVTGALLAVGYGAIAMEPILTVLRHRHFYDSRQLIFGLCLMAGGFALVSFGFALATLTLNRSQGPTQRPPLAEATL
jgi:hypothetical protein